MKQFLLSTLKWLATITVAVGIVMGVRYYCIESYCVSTDAMQEALQPGDYIFVNKLPSDGNPGRNRVVLFTSPLLKDTVARPLFLSRCIGMPGDTIEVSSDGYRVNGKFLPLSPRSLATYFITQGHSAELLKTLKKLHIPVRNWKSDTYGSYLSLTSFEEYQIREELPATASNHFVRNRIAPYTLVVPRKGQAYRLNEATLMACKEAIQAEAGCKAAFRDGKLYLDGRESSFFFFGQDYFWMLSDNVNESVDSRHLGFVPRSHILGNAWFCWYSSDKQRIFKPVN